MRALVILALALSGCFLPNETMPLKKDVYRAPVTYPEWKHDGAYWSPCNYAATDQPWLYHWFPFDTCLACVTAAELGTIPRDNQGRSIEGTCHFAMQNDFTDRKRRSLKRDLRKTILDSQERPVAR